MVANSKEDEMKLIKKINWDIVQAILLVGTLPTALIIGALFPSLFAHY
jgi:hypothetical protein